MKDLPVDHSLVHVTYAPLPPKEELGRQFPCLSDNLWQKWGKHSECCDEVPGPRLFHIKEFQQAVDARDAILWGYEHGYAPATHKEAIEYDRAYPVDIDRFSLIALGSFTFNTCDRLASAVIVKMAGTKTLTLVNHFWAWVPEAGYRFLFIRNSIDLSSNEHRSTWNEIERMFVGDDVYKARATTRALSLLDKVLRQRHPGEDFRARLTSACATHQTLNYAQIWQAYQTRTALAHEEREPHPALVQRAFEAFRAALRAMSII